MFELTWASFALFALLAWIACIYCVRRYADPYESSKFVVFIASTALWTGLFALLVLPVDVFVASGETDSNTGLQVSPSDFESAQESVKALYYAFWCILVFFAFVLFPFAYFYYEESGDPDLTRGQKIFNAFKYSCAFMIVCGVVCIIGAFVTVASDDEDDSWRQRLVEQASQGDVVVAFLFACVTLLGSLLLAVYAPVGLASLPMGLIQSRQSLHDIESASMSEIKPEQVRARLQATQEQLRHQRRRVKNDPSDREERQRLQELQREKDRLEHLLQRADKHANSDKKEGCGTCIWNALAPLRFAFGIVLFGVSALIAVSVFMSALDRAINSECGAACGFALDRRHIFNPLDDILASSSSAFPVDYLLYGLLVLLLFVATLDGLSVVGVRFLCFKLYGIKRRRTLPNALLLGCWMVLLCSLASIVLVDSVAPKYTSFTTQRFREGVVSVPPTYDDLCSSVTVSPPADDAAWHSCDMQHSIVCPGQAAVQCAPTVMNAFLNTIKIGLPFFGLVYFAASWLFVLVFCCALVWAIFFKKAPVVDELDETRRDLLESVFD
ncbi:MAG: hypothetical protein MHM6MM_004048 [Cercozoa sp. M6MM]